MLLNFAEHTSRCLSLSITKIKYYLNLNLRFVNLINKISTFSFNLLLNIFNFIICHLTSLNDSIYLALNFIIALLKQISLCAQHVHIIVQTIVLFLCFNKWSHSLLNRANPCCFFDLIKSIFHSTHITNVLIHQLFLTFISCDNFCQSEAQHVNMVTELTNLFVFIACILLLLAFIDLIHTAVFLLS